MAKETEKAIKEALMKRALGYEYEEKIIEARKDGSQKVKEETHTTRCQSR